MLEDLRGRKVARSLAVGYSGGAEAELPVETECRFKQHDSGTIGCTGDLGVVRPEIKLNRSVPVIRDVIQLRSPQVNDCFVYVPIRTFPWT